MNEVSNHLTAPISIEEMVNDSLCHVRNGIQLRYQKCENQIRKSPTTSVIGAVAVGYLLHRLPVRAILVTQVRVLSALTPPALFLFGAAKLYDYLQRREITQ